MEQQHHSRMSHFRNGHFKHFKNLGSGWALVLIFFLFGQMIASDSQSAVLKGKVTSVRENVIELDSGSEKGIKLGDSDTGTPRRLGTK